MYLAHMVWEQDGSCREQTLRDHNRQVGQYASSCLKKAGLSACGMLAGILHDGKGTPKFQEYLRQGAAWDAFDRGVLEKPSFSPPSRGTVNHTFAGCIYLLDRYHNIGPTERLASEFLACAISSHHGLFDCLSIEKKNGFLHRVVEADREDIQYESAREAFEQEVSSREEIDDLFHKAAQELKALLGNLHGLASPSHNNIFMLLSMAERMLTSALIYGDRRDTAEFMDNQHEGYGDIKPDWDRDIRDFENLYEQFPPSTKPINKARASISMQCREFADEADGSIYQLNVPTGGGKTLSSLRYALYHARKYNKSRIIYVIPLLTIIDQNAAEIRRYLPSEEVLEHHSDVLTDTMTKDELGRYDLMKDRWTAPVIITTLVQILDILFSGKTQSIARMRALSNAVLIFDEVQSVPYKTIALFNAAINYLAKFCGSTVILCSATQPAFDQIQSIPLMLTDKQMVYLTDAEMNVFKRHQYHEWDGHDVTLKDVGHFALSIVQAENPLMIVCNVKSEALRLYHFLSEQNDDQLLVMHLSAGMCKAHRKRVLEDISAKLNEIQNQASSQKLILVTTQLVEAGVNLSFRSVIRLMAGDDNLVQAAGRCNRSDEYHGHGDVYLVKLQGEEKSLSMLPEIKDARNAMVSAIAGSGNTPFSPASQTFIRSYYRRLFNELDRRSETKYPFCYNGATKYAVNLLESQEQQKDGEPLYMMHQPFKTVGMYFRVFEENTTSVLVPYHEEGAHLIQQMEDAFKATKNIPKQLLRRAGEYSITIYEYQKRVLGEKKFIHQLGEDLLSKDFSNKELPPIYRLDAEAYQEDIGLSLDAERTVDDFIF
ncbi:MAG: CRISPR-associated helicase Cas3' [Eubacterium sp.]